MNSEETSLEVKIGKLETKVDFLIDKVGDLEKGLVNRVERMEVGKFSSIDFVQFRNNEFIPLQKKVDKLWWNLAIFLGGGGALVTLINWYLLYKSN